VVTKYRCSSSKYGKDACLTLPKSSSTTKNIIGKVIRIDEPKGAWLTHHYDSIGNLIKTVVGGVTTTMEYFGL
jgi:hypothetical protein